jgi:hypothetical protein
MQTEMLQNPASLQDGPSAGQQQEAPAGPDLGVIKDTVSRNLSRMLRFRRPYDPVRFKWFRQYVSSRDSKTFPDGLTQRANTFVPYAFSNVETVVSRTHDALFSVRPFFEVNGRGEQDEPAAEKMQLVLNYKLHRGQLPQAIEELTRNVAIYGHGAIKVDWDWGFDVVTKPQTVPIMVPIIGQDGQRVIDPLTGQPQMQPMINPMTGQPLTRVEVQTTTVMRNCPKFHIIDPYDLLVDPDGGMVAQCLEKTLGQLKKEAMAYKASTQQDLYFPQGLADLEEKLATSAKDGSPDDVLVRMAEYWNKQDNTLTVITFGEDRDAVAWKDQRYAVRSGSSYSPYKRQMYVGDAIVLYHGPNPFAHKQIPIVYTSYVKLPNEPYGLGIIEIGGDLNEALNQMVSMIRDNWNIGINHRLLYDTTMDIDHEALNNANVPGGKVGVSGDPSKAVFPLPNFTPNNNDYQLLELYKGQIELATGISDFYSKGVGGPGANSTATGISSIINESNYRFKLFIRNLELDVLQPLLEMCAMNCIQFMTDQQEMLVTEAPAMIPKYVTISPEQIVGAFQFDLVAANYATNETVRQRNLMALAGLMQENPYINQFEATKLLLKTFKIPEYISLLKSEQQVQMEQAAAAQQQMQMMILQHQGELEKIKVQAEAKIEEAKARGQEHPGKPDVANIGKDIAFPLPGANGSSVDQVLGGGGGKKEGRPRRPMQPEGQIPGAGNTSGTRGQAQSMGLNSMGLAGTAES